MRHTLICLLGLLAGCAVQRGSYSMQDFARLAKIDVHVHINSPDPALLEQARTDGFRLVTINTDYPDFPPLAEQLRIAQRHAKTHPDLVAYVATFSMTGWGKPDWQQRTISQLDDAFSQGAIGVKVWKNVGMALRGEDGRLVMIDDPGFSPIFAFIKQRDKVLIGHQGEPRNCWLPIAAMTVNNDKEYFRDHPQYHMYLHPELPSYEAQMAARDRMLDANHDLKFIGAHLASLEWNVDELARFLRRYPHALVDVAARLGQVQFQSAQDRDKVRRFFIAYQDRLLYGTDLTQDPGADPGEVRREAHDTWLRDWKYLNTDQSQRVPELDAPVRGLALPRDVVRKIYSENALRWFGTAWKTQ